MIPKIIHYCWFGGNEKSDIIEKCIESWKKYCPNYQIIEWNEKNFDVNCNSYVKDAYEAKKWAFVSDYTRLYAVYKMGGVYLDTDVLLHNKIENLLEYECWLAQEETRYINTGIGFGAIQGHKLIRKLMESYETGKFSNTVNGILDTAVVERELVSWKKSEYSQTVNGIHIIGLKDYSKYAKHLATISWMPEEDRKKRETKIRMQFEETFYSRIYFWLEKRLYYIKRFLRSRKINYYFEKKKGTLGQKIYTFIVYDLLDNGPWYYIKRLGKKWIRK